MSLAQERMWAWVQRVHLGYLLLTHSHVKEVPQNLLNGLSNWVLGVQGWRHHLSYARRCISRWAREIKPSPLSPEACNANLLTKDVPAYWF